jgi:signal transduction histidine kinase
MAVKEAVHNIIKHARASEVTLRISFSDGVLDVAVRDDGSGFQPADNVSGNGLSNIKQRLHNIGGNSFVESQIGQGATVRIRLRIKPAMEIA